MTDTICPRCGRPMERPRIALSRTDNQTGVCDLCGHAEGIEEWESRLTPQDAWPLPRPDALRVMLIPVAGAPLVMPLAGGDDVVSRTVHDLVGGYFEALAVPEHEAHAYVNEDGRMLNLAPNFEASKLLRRDIVGDVVVFGSDDLPDEGDVPTSLLSAFGLS